MKKALLSFIVIAFFIWLLPLGVFIKPSQEKTACGGQRAICMCQVQMTKSQSKPLEGISLKGGSNQKNENASAKGGGSNYFTIALFKGQQDLVLARLFENESLRYTNPYSASFEHVPKV